MPDACGHEMQPYTLAKQRQIKTGIKMPKYHVAFSVKAKRMVFKKKIFACSFYLLHSI